jgi:hypothetical protein
LCSIASEPVLCVASACSDRVKFVVFADPSGAGQALVVVCSKYHPIVRTVGGPFCCFGVVTAGVFVRMMQKLIRSSLCQAWQTLSPRPWAASVVFVASCIVRASGTNIAILAYSLCDYTPVAWNDCWLQIAEQHRDCAVCHPHFSLTSPQPSEPQHRPLCGDGTRDILSQLLTLWEQRRTWNKEQLSFYSVGKPL